MDKKDFLSYEDFGAVGDGIHDDFAAIVACHTHANEHSMPVRARDGAIYYIGGAAITARIMTDTDFGTARFIIDDRSLEDRLSFCFEIASEHEELSPEIGSVMAGQKHINLPYQGSYYVRIEGDHEKRVFIRKGLNANKGAVPAESFIVDADGNILTDINWNYEKVSSARAKCVDDAPITVKGGIFTTVANQWLCATYDTHNRGFNVTRSHVTIKDLVHYVEDEHNEMGAPYGGFISVGMSYDTTIENVMLTPHYAYKRASNKPPQLSNMGTYDLLLTYAIGVRLIGLKQTRSIHEFPYWGLMGSNYSKDVTLDDCEISRFDAHCGITNGHIRNCKLGHAGLNLVGYGEFTVENTEITCDRFIRFREDYGSSFDGRLIIKNCVWHPMYKNDDLEIFCAYNDGSHYFGYQSVMVRELIIDGLTVDDTALAPGKTITLLPEYDREFTNDKPFPLKTPETAHIRGLKAMSGKEIRLFKRPELYTKTKFIIEDRPLQKPPF